MTSARVAVHSPGRVNIIGDHTDYAGGLALPCAIDLGVSITGHTDDERIELRSETLDGIVSFPIDAPPAIASIEPRWGRHVAAVAAELSARTGLVGRIDSTLPVGAGLSSSAAFDVALALALGDDRPRMELARLAQRAETTAVGVPCGLLDQMSVVFGRVDHAMLIDFSDDTFEQVPFPEDLVIWILHSGQERELADSQYAERRRSCEIATERIGPLATSSIADLEVLDGDVRRRARHVITECERVRLAAAALRDGDPVRLGELMVESHASLRDDFDVSTAILDDLVARLLAIPGVHGARLTGAGFGGCVVALCERGSVTDPSELTGRGWLVRPADGAHRMTD